MAAWSRAARRYALQLWLERPALNAVLALAAAAADDRLLDIATGTGALLHRLARRTDRPVVAIGVDASTAMLAQAPALPPQWLLLHADARALPFAGASFDVVTAAYVLHTVGEPTRRAILAEARRVLRGRGRLVTVTPAPPRSPLASALLAPVLALACRSSGTLGGLRPLDPRADLERAGFTIERTVRVRWGYPSLCTLATPA